MKLENVVPFGRSLDEYCKMFTLTPADIDCTMVGIGDGPASFNAELYNRGKSVTSIDPVYALASNDIETQFYRVVDDIIDQVKASHTDWSWSYHKSPEHLRQARVAVLEQFLADFERGKTAGRYVSGELPELPFTDRQFQLALCSHLLFLYSDHFSYDFHRVSVLEMLRIADEVRIFPLLTLMREKSPYLRPLITELKSAGFEAQVETVDYELQKGGNEMLRIRRPE